MQFTATTKHIAGGISSATTGTCMGSVGDNGIGVGGGNRVSSGGNNGVGSAGEVGVGFVDMSFGGNNKVGSNEEVDAGGNPGDAIVCSGTLSTIAIGLASFRFNVAALISPTAGRNHPTPVSSVFQVGPAIKLPSLLSRVQLAPWAVSISAVVRPFKDTQEVTVYKKLLAMASDEG